VDLAVGSRWKSVVCTTEVVVVRSLGSPATLKCGGAEMVLIGTEGDAGSSIDPDLAGGTQLGKRYTSEASGIEILCSKAGEGTLTLDGEPLEIKGAKPLPSSD
jgi:hypothetical protein